MAMVRVRVNATVHGWRRGEVVTVERTPRIAGMIKNQYLSVIDDVVDDFAPDDPEVSADSPVTAGNDPNWSDDQPPITFTYRGSENEGGATDFGTPLPAGGGAAATGSVGTLGVTTKAVPPRTGKGSGAAPWRAFLESEGIDHSAVGAEDRAALIALWDAEQERRRG